jgi:hypothetical protein
MRITTDGNQIGFYEVANFLQSLSLCSNSQRSDRDVGENLIAVTLTCPSNHKIP